MRNVCCAFGCKARLREREFFYNSNGQRRREMWINALGFVPSTNAGFVVNISFQVNHSRACTNVCQTDVQDGIFS